MARVISCERAVWTGERRNERMGRRKESTKIFLKEFLNLISFTAISTGAIPTTERNFSESQKYTCACTHTGKL